jgi:phage tail-like protein
MSEIKLLFKLSGPDIPQDQVIVTRQGLRVGRTKDNNLALDSREISRQHVRIVWRAEDDKYYVEDLNSSNGTWLNDTRLPPRDPRELRPGDVVRMGPFLLTFIRFVMPSLEPQLPDLPLQMTLSQVNGKKPIRDPFPPGVPRDRSTWLKYLPAIYEDDDFIGRYLLIFESMMSPLFWILDNFDLYLSPDLAPEEWLHWFAGWVDMLMLPELPEDRKREIARQIGWLFLRRGTKAQLERLLELYFGVSPEIVESTRDACHFVVKLPLSQSKVRLGADVADRLIAAQRPAFASYTLEIT